MHDIEAAAKHSVEMHDHAVCAYATEEELLAALAAFVSEGLARRELVVFVHAFDTEEAGWRFVERAAPGLDAGEREKVVVVSLYEAAFEGGSRRIDREHVGRVVEGLVARAQADGLAGTRIFVDASRRYFAGSRTSEWFEFETWLGRRLQAKVGLVCAYQRSDIMRPDVLPEVLRTHAYRFDAP
ncbi:MAG TPA: MEDS domain-containing protein [Candidatus Thermoplasmatota archaeon]|nr:MEDS domain-containing protein [Candidatus Thermoplasmatota archaeon]